MSVKEYTGQAILFFQKYGSNPDFTKVVPLKTGTGTAIRVTVGNTMGVFTHAGKILTFHP